MNLLLIGKFKDFIDLKYALVCSLYARLHVFWRTKILEVLFWYVTCHASIRWISKVYNVLRIVSGRKRFNLYKSQIDFSTFIDISVLGLTKFNLLSSCMPKNLVSLFWLLGCLGKGCSCWARMVAGLRRTRCYLQMIQPQRRGCVDLRVSLVEYAKEESWEWM